MKKTDRIKVEEALTSRVYDLILNEETANEERALLIEFKNKVAKNGDFERAEIDLATQLRRLAMVRLKHKEKLSSGVGKLYMEISTTGMFKKNLGWGLIAMSFMYHG
ncbi:bacteriocin immunity protein [Dellaglioa carnosa]|uniref:bacteriocin immunity protein n=1 Tax=Dellaglioa carnosa TaxID=2995136 RepID=UPI0022A83FD5|nr:bacteriocin immunity protein [Dellaglioa carnosa]MCZ2492230.1 bacteriocin immunity protein [Dellaglioa carnosa]